MWGLIEKNYEFILNFEFWVLNFWCAIVLISWFLVSKKHGWFVFVLPCGNGGLLNVWAYVGGDMLFSLSLPTKQFTMIIFILDEKNLESYNRYPWISAGEVKSKYLCGYGVGDESRYLSIGGGWGTPAFPPPSPCWHPYPRYWSEHWKCASWWPIAIAIASNYTPWWVLCLYDAIQAFPTPELSDIDNVFVWSSKISNKYIVKSDYSWLLNLELDELPHYAWGWSRSLKVSEKVYHLLWLISHKALPTNALSFAHHLSSSPMCDQCLSTKESIFHCLSNCSKPR